MKQLKLVVLLAIVLTACGARDTSTPSGQPATTVPGTNNSPAPSTNNTAATNVPAPTGAAPAATPSGSTTETAATPVSSTPPATAATVAPKPQPKPKSTGPLAFTGSGVYVANCRLTPTTDKPGGIVIQISIEVTGGNGVYQYFDNDGKQWPSKFIDVQGEKGTASLGRVKVTSGDGQSIDKEYDISPGDLTCK
jgi:hypothetical protein